MLTPVMVRRFPKSGPTDPIELYRRPLVGWLYRERINRGLRLLGRRRFGRALEIGFGAGALQLAMSRRVTDLHGVDTDSDPARVSELLLSMECRSHLLRGSALALPYAAETFELIFCFSVMEHLHRPEIALAEMRRVARPGGLVLIGMPAVNRVMELGFRLIGFKGIDALHVTPPAAVRRHFAVTGLRPLAENHLRPPPGIGPRLYYNWLLEVR